MQIAAFFDLDRTLITVNSGKLWMDRERRLGKLSLPMVLEAMVRFAAYSLSIGQLDNAMRKALSLYVGVPEAEVEQDTRDWWQQEIAPTVAPGGRRALARHRADGHHLALLTSSSPYVSAAALQTLDLDGFISSRYEIKDGHFTGEPVLPLCFGQGKVVLAEAYCQERGLDLDRSYFYSDSYTDLPMLLRVGQPRVVNPDLRLRLAARRRGWRRLDWSA